MTWGVVFVEYLGAMSNLTQILSLSTTSFQKLGTHSGFLWSRRARGVPTPQFISWPQDRILLNGESTKKI